MSLIYLDNNATTLIHPDVASVISDALARQFANPASQHQYGRLARQYLEACRDQTGECLGLSQADQLVFTSGGTEANNLAVFGHFPGDLSLTGFNIVASSFEHPSLLAAFESLKARGIEVRSVAANARGFVNADEFASRLDSRTKLVCCSAANGDIGSIQPVSEIASTCFDLNIPFHVDAVQAIGKVDFNFSAVKCSTASVSAHKIHGPVGIGGLMVKNGLKLAPMVFGGFQQDGIRPGTESVPLAAGFAKSVEMATVSRESNAEFICSLRDEFEQLVLSRISLAKLNGLDAPRLCNTSNISFIGVDRQLFVIAADLAGLACSTGSACSSGSSQPSAVLAAMNSKKEIIESAVRFGFSCFNSRSEVGRAVDLISGIVSKIKAAK